MDVFEIKRKILRLVKAQNRPDFEGFENEWWDKNGKPRKRRLIIVYNPNSSRAIYAKAEVVAPLKRIPGIMVGKFEVAPTNVDENAERLAKILLDGDIVVTAGGDGTAAIGLNGVILSKKDVRFMAVPFGNFNDMPRMLSRASGKVLYPLEALIDGKHFRYAACYFTVGMFAESTEIFDDAGIRKKLQEGDRKALFSIMRLAKWYFKNRHKVFLPKFKLYTKPVGKEMIKRNGKGASDYLAVNSITVAKFMKGDIKLFNDSKNFISATGQLNSFRKLMKFMLKSMFKRIPGEISEKDNLVFAEKAKIEIQAEGEYKRFDDVSEIVIRKAEKPIKIL